MKGEQAQAGAFYGTPDLQELPLCLRVEHAARLLGLDTGTAWRLARTTWRPFVKKTGGLWLIKTAGLLRWIDSDEDDKEDRKETDENGTH